MTAETRSPSHAPPALRPRAAPEYAIEGDLRFLSHHDELRMLTRALVRSGWPLAYSQGFNPQPRLSIPLPRRTGIAAARQLAIVDLNAAMPADDLHARLAQALPAGVPLIAVTSPLTAGTPHATHAVFDVLIDPADQTELPARIAAALGEATLPLQRNTGPGKPLRTLDIRPFIQSLTLDGPRLRMALAFEGQLSARPAEILTVLALDPGRYECCARRVEVTWDMPIAVGPLRPGENTRNHLGQEEDHTGSSGFDSDENADTQEGGAAAGD